eukprot:COSAG02_NODE_1129_length_14415_cov_828.291911_12_plen_73_part_00
MGDGSTESALQSALAVERAGMFFFAALRNSVVFLMIARSKSAQDLPYSYRRFDLMCTSSAGCARIFSARYIC